MNIPVLIPLYNGVEFLAEALDSLLNQTWPHWTAYIGVNGHGEDGGAVGSLAKALATLDTRIHVHVQGPNIQGKVAALHDLLATISKDDNKDNEWIALLDADDRWHPTKLEEQVVALQGPARGADVIGTWCRYFGEMTGGPALPTGFVDAGVLTYVNPLINSSVLIRRPWCRWRYVEGGYGMEDYELWMQVVLGGGRLYNVGKVLVDHRIHAESAFNTQKQDPRQLQDQFVRTLSDSKLGRP
jgi:glycosyltransferase involved in cell wall biosynthesis